MYEKKIRNLERKDTGMVWDINRPQGTVLGRYGAVRISYSVKTACSLKKI